MCLKKSGNFITNDVFLEHFDYLCLGETKYSHPLNVLEYFIPWGLTHVSLNFSQHLYIN